MKKNRNGDDAGALLVLRGWAGRASMAVGAAALALGCGSVAPANDEDGGTVGGSEAGSSTSEGATGGEGATGTDGATDGGSGETGEATETGEDGAGAACRPIATRLIVLGDSIPACVNVGGKDADACSPKQLHTAYAEAYGPTTYENLSAGGAVTADVLERQIPNIETGTPGHALVVVYIGGNDLSPFLTASDDAAVTGYNNLAPEIEQTWVGIFSFFADPDNFPDGVTIMMNKQYDPFDGCTAPPFNISQVKLGLLVDYNDAMQARGETLDWVFVADQYTSYLGHGHHWNASACPNYMADGVAWMDDLIHPNNTGHANLATVMSETAATMFADCP